MRYHSYLNSASQIIEAYHGEMPFAAFIKKYFAANKKYGGRDRKQIASLCYHFYRLGKAVPQLPVQEKIIVAVFLCEQSHSDFLHFHKPEWNELVSQPLDEKLAVVRIHPADIFPWEEELSAGINTNPFIRSFFKQPDLFIRIRPGKKDAVINKLQQGGLQFELLQDDCIALPNTTKIDTVLETDREVVIQDGSSQQVLDFLSTNQHHFQSPVVVWDCCAASGGKSILAYDIFEGDVQLFVSDIRQSIIANLIKRFEAAGIGNYQTFTADLTASEDRLPVADFPLIICDAPCTGSGTWSRTPEQLYYFKRRTIDEFAALQQKITERVLTKLLPGGTFIYITCSVFKKENEDIASFIKEKFHLQLLQMELLKGYDKSADSMFVAVFRK